MHYIDARVIAGSANVIPLKDYYVKKVRCHNRQIRKAKILKDGVKKLKLLDTCKSYLYETQTQLRMLEAVSSHV